MIGRAWLELGKVEDALAALDQAVARAPEDPWIHLDRGRALEESGDDVEAEKEYRKAIELEAGFSRPHLYLAWLLDELRNEPQEALGHYRDYLELGGPDPDGTVAARIEQLEK